MSRGREPSRQSKAHACHTEWRVRVTSTSQTAHNSHDTTPRPLRTATGRAAHQDAQERTFQVPVYQFFPRTTRGIIPYIPPNQRLRATLVIFMPACGCNCEHRRAFLSDPAVAVVDRAIIQELAAHASLRSALKRHGHFNPDTTRKKRLGAA